MTRSDTVSITHDELEKLRKISEMYTHLRTLVQEGRTIHIDMKNARVGLQVEGEELMVGDNLDQALSRLMSGISSKKNTYYPVSILVEYELVYEHHKITNRFARYWVNTGEVSIINHDWLPRPEWGQKLNEQIIMKIGEEIITTPVSVGFAQGSYINQEQRESIKERLMDFYAKMEKKSA